MRRRSLPNLCTELADASDTPCGHARAGWQDDLRLFVTTWAAGFLFFLLILS